LSIGKRERALPRQRMTAAARREVIERAATEVFAERGYHGASIDEIARRSGVTPPVVYDHFASKVDLHRRLLERTRDELLAMWIEHLGRDDQPEQPERRIVGAIYAWCDYVESHRYAVRMFFRETTGDPAVQAVHREIQAQARMALTAILAREPGVERMTEAGGADALEMAAEVMRAGLTGLAIWWDEHPHVSREQIVATAMNSFWTGFGRIREGDAWAP
jgi:AcrR family transcriptional regulator